MKKITALAALTAAGLALAAPAHADGHGSRSRINIAGRTLNGNKLCEQALGLVPLAAPWTGQSVYDACNGRDHADHPRSQQPSTTSEWQ
ncbi:hypothetical protein ACVB8X_38930 [Streptomyces sp. NRAIS4]